MSLFRNTWRYPAGHPQAGKLQRSKSWSYEFTVRSIRVKESAHTENRALAKKIEAARRLEVEAGGGRVDGPKKPQTFALAAKQYIEMGSAHWSERNIQIEQYNVDALLPAFGKMLLTAITADDITRFQVAQKKRELSPRTINMSVGTMRAILRKHKLWAFVEQDVKMLAVRNEIGRALSADEQFRLVAACKKSRSRSLYPAVLLSLHTGLRNGEMRLLKWRQIDLIEGYLTVGKSKTAGGDGRGIPLSVTALACLKEWRAQFPECQPGHYVFPTEGYAAKADPAAVGPTAGAVYGTDPTKPILSWKSGWTVARKAAKVSCRWHDLRHCFVSALAEGAASDATIKALSGHVSNKMLERYSHTRNEAKRAAIAAFDPPANVETHEISPKWEDQAVPRVQ